MENHGTVRPMTSGQFKDLASAVVQAIPSSLPSEDAQWWIGHKAELARNLEFLRNPASGQFPIFKTITLGVYQSVSAYREALEKAGFLIGTWASDVLNRIQVSQSQVQLDLVVLSVAELRFSKAVRYDAICAKAKDFGFELCPPEMGLALRLAYPDQPYGEWLRIAMNPIVYPVYPGSVPQLFVVGHGNDGRILLKDFGNTGTLWPLGCRFVFVRPHKQ